jgi:valyl-tRNA synthetase
MHNNNIPWDNIVISGHVLADSKEKLSKSKEQKSLSPEHLLSQYPADVIRYWTASGNLGHDVAFSDNQLKIGIRLTTKLWNAFRFINEHVNANNSTETPLKLGLINQWLLHELSETFNTYQTYLEKNEFGLALGAVEQFFWNTFCDNYLELIKDQLFNPDGYDHDELFATRWTLHHAGLRILQMFAPYMPFITEAIYATFSESKTIDSVHKTKFANIQKFYDFAQEKDVMKYVLTIISQVRKIKTEHQLSLRTDIQTMNIYLPNTEILEALKKQEQLLKGTTRALAITYVNEDRDQSELKQQHDTLHADIKAS